MDVPFNKFVTILSLNRELLSQQQHYDWGLRALKTVLRGCGNLLQSHKQNNGQGRFMCENEKGCESHINLQAVNKYSQILQPCSVQGRGEGVGDLTLLSPCGNQ